MARFTFSKIFAPWTNATTAPTRPGWYRTRTQVLSHSWWNGMAYFDGESWWEFGKYVSLSVRKEVKVLQWQGLAMPARQALALLRANLPRSARARRDFEKSLTYYFGDLAAA